MIRYGMLPNVLISLITVTEDSFPNFIVSRKKDNVHHSSHMDIIGKVEMQLKRQQIMTNGWWFKGVHFTHLMRMSWHVWHHNNVIKN